MRNAGILSNASMNKIAITRRNTIAPAVPQKIARLRNASGKFFAAMPITMALSPANNISIIIICRIANNPCVDVISTISSYIYYLEYILLYHREPVKQRIADSNEPTILLVC